MNCHETSAQPTSEDCMVRLVRREITEHDEVTRQHVSYLVTGCGYFIDIKEWPDDMVLDLWRLVRPYVWTQLIESLPGWRCYSFWRFEAPECRRTTDGSVHP